MLCCEFCKLSTVFFFVLHCCIMFWLYCYLTNSTRDAVEKFWYTRIFSLILPYIHITPIINRVAQQSRWCVVFGTCTQISLRCPVFLKNKNVAGSTHFTFAVAARRTISKPPNPATNWNRSPFGPLLLAAPRKPIFPSHRRVIDNAKCRFISWLPK